MFKRLAVRARNIVEENHTDVKFKHVAFIIKGKRVLFTGWNKKKTHPAVARFGYNDKVTHIHAELDAIIRYGKTDCRNNTLVVMRLHKDNSLANSKPCKGCQHVIEQVGFKNVYYSDSTGKFVRWENA